MACCPVYTRADRQTIDGFSYTTAKLQLSGSNCHQKGFSYRNTVCLTLTIIPAVFSHIVFVNLWIFCSCLIHSSVSFVADWARTNHSKYRVCLALLLVSKDSLSLRNFCCKALDNQFLPREEGSASVKLLLSLCLMPCSWTGFIFMPASFLSWCYSTIKEARWLLHSNKLMEVF